MSDYPMLISNKLHSFRNFGMQVYRFLYYGALAGCKEHAGAHRELCGIQGRGIYQL